MNLVLRSLLCFELCRALAFPQASAAVTGSPKPLVGRAWRVTRAPSPPPSGQLYIFLPNGTLLMTSCVETYRIAVWKTDPSAPNTLRITEDGQFVSTLTVTSTSGATLHLRQKLVRSQQISNFTLTPVEKEFVCPDLPKP